MAEVHALNFDLAWLPGADLMAVRAERLTEGLKLELKLELEEKGMAYWTCPDLVDT